VGDFVISYPINDNWAFDFFYFYDPASTFQDITKPQQGGGISLKYRQDFNNKKDFLESWKRRNKKSQK
jgi:hypothetical protein